MQKTILKFKKMNREKLQSLASEWVRVAKNDIRNKVIEFMHEVDASPRELAYVLAISNGEMEQILEGNGEITLTTFANILIATGNSLEIKPIEDTPIGDYDNIPSEEELLEQPLPRPNVFGGHMPPIPPPPSHIFNREVPSPHHCCGGHTHPSVLDLEDDENFFDSVTPPTPHYHANEEEETPRKNRRGCNHSTLPRDDHGRFMSPSSSPFNFKSKDELAKIIKEHLWDSELDLTTATKEELVEFLDKKNERIQTFKRIHELESDPKVAEFKERLKKTVDENPNLREWTRKFLGLEG